MEYNKNISDKNISDEIKLICINNTGCENYLTLNKLYECIKVSIGDGNYELAFRCDDGDICNMPFENLKKRFIIQAELREQQIKSVLDD